MIKVLSVRFENKFHLDNTLQELVVQPIDFNATLEQISSWLYGTAKANNLTLEIENELFILKNKDFASTDIIQIGSLNEEFISTASSLGWDIFQVDGFTLIEYPIAHKPIIDKIASINSIHYEFEISMLIVDTNNDAAHGLNKSNLVQIAVESFDVLNYRNPKTSISLPTLTVSNETLEYLQDNTYTITLSCRSGNTATQRIDKQSNYLTTSRDALSQTISQNVTTFTSGLIISLSAYPKNTLAYVSVDLELSEDISTTHDQLPVISRRSVVNHNSMALNDTWLIGKFDLTKKTQEKRKSFFLPFSTRQSENSTMIVTCKRTK